jgi:hypothetical protein
VVNKETFDGGYNFFTKWNPGDGYSRRRLTLDEAMDICGAKWRGDPHITFNPGVKHQYRLIVRHRHDGTTAFTQELLLKAMARLFGRSTYYKPDPPKDGYLPHYTVGNIRHALVFGKVDLPVGCFPGCRESFVIPVRVDWVPAPGVVWDGPMPDPANDEVQE